MTITAVPCYRCDNQRYASTDIDPGLNADLTNAPSLAHDLVRS